MQEGGARSAPGPGGGRRRHGQRRTPAAAAGKPIVIGWADDSTGNMAPFDDPALLPRRSRSPRSTRSAA